MPASHRVPGLADADLPAVDEDLAAVDRIGAEDGARDLGAAGAHQAGEAEDLALAQREADVADFAAAAEVPRFEHDLRSGWSGIDGRSSRQRAADHHGDDVLATGVVSAGTVSTYSPSRMTVTRSAMRFSSSILCEM